MGKVLGSLFNSKAKTTSKNEPWAPQGDALKDIFSKAQGLYQSQAGSPAYQGDLYANMDPATREAINSMLAYTKGTGMDTANQLTGSGGAMVGDGSNMGGAIANYASAAGADPTQGNIDAAMAYANNPAIDGMIDAASRDVTRNLYENQLTGIDRAAVGSGNINSTRSGVAQGIAMRGAQDQIGDISSTIRGTAYDRGLALAEQARGTNLNALGNTAGLYGQQFNNGVNAMGAGNGIAMGNFGAAVDGSQLFQQDAQGQLDADFAQWNMNDTRQWDLLNRYYGIVGGNNWGGTQTSTAKESGNYLGKMAGMAASVAGMMGGGGAGGK